MKRSELIYRVEGISAALRSWDDVEALRLMRLAWTDIEAAIKEKTERQEETEGALS